MLHYLFAALMFLHGIIHLVGYTKAFRYSELKNITVPISKSVGVIWITACLLFIASGILYLLKSDYWWMTGLASVALSQTVIILGWKDAKYGTIANLIILVVIILAAYQWLMK
jgi:hypothetical protein